MDKKYYLHRISNEDNVAYDLADKGYLSLGWSLFADTNILEEARKPGYPEFENICAEKGCAKDRSRWVMWYFAQMQKGDYVVVPQYSGLFSVYEVEGPAESISAYADKITGITGKWTKVNVIWKDKFLYDATNQYMLDLGFLIPVKPIIKDAQRSYVAPKLISRMKIRQTNADITDIKDAVDEGIEAWKKEKPISLYETAVNKLTENMWKSIIETMDPDKFEKLVEWYMKQCGGKILKTSKNEPGKKDGADADVAAEFENLKYIVYIQAKRHDGETDNWAVKQIERYKEQKSANAGDPDYTYASWVVSSAERYSAEAEEEAAANGVRLIDGKEFARMLVDVGLKNLDDAFTKKDN